MPYIPKKIQKLNMSPDPQKPPRNSYCGATENTSDKLFKPTNNTRGRKPLRFDLKLRVHCETALGEHVAVVGEMSELGLWKDFNKCAMQWTEGHIWETVEPIICSKPHFLYKYVIIENGQVKRWEQGANRLADLFNLPER